jgi:hypothetical protein
MRTLLSVLLFLTVFFCLVPRARADEGLVLAGTCDDSGAWLTKAFSGLPAKAATGAVDAAAKVPSGLKLREVTAGRPLEAKALGNIKAGSEVKVTALRVLGATPGSPHAVWARVMVAPDRILKP